MVQNGTTTSHSASDSKSSSTVTSTTQTGLNTTSVTQLGQFSGGSYSFGTVSYVASGLDTTVTGQSNQSTTSESGSDTTAQANSMGAQQRPAVAALPDPDDRHPNRQLQQQSASDGRLAGHRDGQLQRVAVGQLQQ